MSSKTLILSKCSLKSVRKVKIVYTTYIMVIREVSVWGELPVIKKLLKKTLARSI